MNASRLDHLIVVAASLDEGAAWCRAQLGVAPVAGGRHTTMATHNSLLRVATVDYPRAYLEVIATDPLADESLRRAEARWFDMDDAAFMSAIAQDGPRLTHFAVNVADLSEALAAWRMVGIDGGVPIRASRMTARGLLEWQIAVRSDGKRLFDGCLPTLIQWGEVHPISALPESGVALQTVDISHPRAGELLQAFDAIGLAGVRVCEGPARIAATLLTPGGRITIG